ncbi:MAG: KEOPS complex subunit Pcc1 [Candidatus Methanomethylophilaceae archaeon]
MRMTIESEYPDAKSAETIYRSIVPDDDGYVTTRIEGNKVIFEFEAENAGQMRSAMDDVLACVKISEGASGLVPVAAPDLDGDTLPE